MASEPNVYAVIVTYNPLKWIDHCFGSIHRSTIPLKTIVVDNCSTDGSPEMIRTSFPEVDLLQAKKNLGFGRANNIGIQKALANGADFILLLNQDAWIQPNTVSALIEVSTQYPQYGILSPMHLNGDGNLDYNLSIYLGPKHCPDLLSDMYTRRLKAVYEAEFINAAAWLMTRACIEKVGLFDPLFFHYGEDTNYCQRARFHGLRIGVCPALRIVHDRGKRKGMPSAFERTQYLILLRSIQLADVNILNLGSIYRKRFLKDLLYFLSALITFDRSSLTQYYSVLSFLVQKRKEIFRSHYRNSHVYSWTSKDSSISNKQLM